MVVPVGSWEQHGPHLPFDTDSIIAESLVDAALDSTLRTAVDEFYVAPTVAISASDEHSGFPGLLSAGTGATVELLTGVARSAAAWARATVFVVGHGGNADALQQSARRLDAEGIPHRFWWPGVVPGHEGDLHAGRVETSVMLHLVPELVDESRIEAGAVGDTADLIDRMRRSGVVAVSTNGVIGDPRGANAAEGAAICAAWTAALVECLENCRRTWPRVRP